LLQLSANIWPTFDRRRILGRVVGLPRRVETPSKGRGRRATAGLLVSKWRTRVLELDGKRKTVPLDRGEAKGYDSETLTYRFTMLNGSESVQFAISKEAMDDLGRVPADGHPDPDDEFHRLRDGIEQIAQRKFFKISEEERQSVEKVLITNQDLVFLLRGA
jgi:Protein of unknown function (DUF1488)